jgi:hypothetical protein
MHACFPVAMHDQSQAERRAVNARDAARLRVRRVTGLFLAGAVAVAASLAAYVAGAASGHSGVTPTSTTGTTTTTSKRIKQVPVPGTPPAPTLHASSNQNATPQAPSVAPPAATQDPPVAVSGGS